MNELYDFTSLIKSYLIDYLHKNLQLINTKMPTYSKPLVIIVWNNLIKLLYDHLPDDVRENF